MVSRVPYSNMREPVRILGIFTHHDVKKCTLNFLRNFASVTASNLDAIELTNGGDFCSSPGEESLITDVDLISGDSLLNHFKAQIFGNVEHCVSCDAVQCTGGEIGRVDHAIFDHKNILSSPSETKPLGSNNKASS